MPQHQVHAVAHAEDIGGHLTWWPVNVTAKSTLRAVVERATDSTSTAAGVKLWRREYSIICNVSTCCRFIYSIGIDYNVCCHKHLAALHLLECVANKRATTEMATKLYLCGLFLITDLSVLLDSGFFFWRWTLTKNTDTIIKPMAVNSQ